MPELSLIEPAFLWLLLLVPLLVAAGLMGHRRLTRRRMVASLALRSVIALALILSLAGAQIVTPLGRVTTIFVVDGSDSVAAAERARGEGYIQQALASLPPDDRAGVVVFGAQALVERTPSDERTLGQIAATPDGSASDIAGGLRLAGALLPAEGQRRIVLISDGGETTGDALELARQGGSTTPIDVVALSGAAAGPDTQVTSADLPTTTRAGQRPRLRIALGSTVEARGQLTVSGPGGTLVDQEVALTPGEQRLEVVLPEPPPGFSRYVIRLRSAGDTRAENDALEAFTFTTGRPRVLVVEGAAGEAAQLVAALRAAGLEVEQTTPGAAPRAITELVLYDATILVNVPRRALADETSSALSAYVHDLGRGLMMVGGPQSFGAGGWGDTPIEAALPVTMDLPPILRTPPVSVVVVIDTSGSMAEEEGGRTKLSLAVEGAQRIASLLRDEDELTVIPFDDAPRDVVGPLPGSRRDEAIRSLEKVQVGGGGITIHDALVEAAKYLRASTHPIRHVITITDGSDTTQQEGAIAIVEGLRAEGVTLTSIAIGDGPDVPFIRSAAVAGGGRTFLTEEASGLPSILIDETQAILKPYIVEEEFVPALGAPHPALRLGGAAPALRGMVLTTPRERAQILLAAADGTPVLAAWQYGLGRSLAWTSDMTGRWGRDWATWGEFPRIAAQLVGWLLPGDLSGGLTLETAAEGAALALDARASDVGGQPRSGLRVAARIFDAQGAPTEATLREVAPGRYRASVAGRRPGAYLVQLIASDAQGNPIAALTAGAVVPLSVEYRTGAANPGLLEGLARISGGRVNPAPGAVFAPAGSGRGAATEIWLWLLALALALLPLDIAVRRLFWRPSARAPQVPVPQVTQPPRASENRPSTPGSAQQPTKPGRAEELARLREERDRARRRARGEE